MARSLKKETRSRMYRWHLLESLKKLAGRNKAYYLETDNCPLKPLVALSTLRMSVRGLMAQFVVIR